MSAHDDERDLDENIHDRVDRLKRKAYRAKLVRRQYIPKGDGRFRPLGIPATEDKLLQLAVARLLEAIDEPDCRPCSYGYRPRTGALEAVDDLTVMLQFGRYRYGAEADIQGFFDNLDQSGLIRRLQERIEDQALLRLIEKWLKAGVLDTDGQGLDPATGTPQGGIVSPLRANGYRHDALDLGFEKVVKAHGTGKARLVGFADDFVCAFENQSDAERFDRALGQRLGKFGLSLSAAKTRVIPFHAAERTRFDSRSVGFEFYWGKDRNGKDHLKRRTSRKKLHKSLQQFAEWCKLNRHRKLKELFRLLNTKLRGDYNDYGVNDNYASLEQFYDGALRLLMKWLNRRSQRHSFTWASFKEAVKHYQVERPRIVGRPKTRMVTSSVKAG